MDINIITQEKYKDIINIINNKSFPKKNKINYSSSPNKYDYKTNNEEREKKPTYKSKSIINYKNKPLTSFASSKRKSNKIEFNSNKKDLLFLDEKLTLEEYEFKIPPKYKNKKYTLIKTLETEEKKINIYTDNKKEVFFPSGVRKEIFNDGYQIVYFMNGDIKQNYPDGKSVYYFNEAKTVQTTFNNGVLVFKFGNNQLERHYPDGKKQILFPDGSERFVLSNGYEETYYPDGRIVKTNNNNNNNGKTNSDND